MLSEFLTWAVRKAYHRNSLRVKKENGHYFITREIVGCNEYLLEGRYSYKQVVAMNALIGENYYCGFGYCEELGPVAFIGCNDKELCSKAGYFIHNVYGYGEKIDDSEYFWNLFPKEDAMNIGNYNVYGMDGVAKIIKVAKIKKISAFIDSRLKSKKYLGRNREKRLIEMDIKLCGFYSYEGACLIATGTTSGNKQYFAPDEFPIQFGIVGSRAVGIINLFEDEIHSVSFFRDVWEYGTDEPEVQDICFIDRETARKLNNFELYFYIIPSCFEKNRYPIEKMDRSFDRRFKFNLPDGSDYRLKIN